MKTIFRQRHIQWCALLMLSTTFIACGGGDKDLKPKPEPSASPSPIVTQTPDPVATQTPEPVETQTPEPVATETPEPVETQAPLCDETQMTDLTISSFAENELVDGDSTWAVVATHAAVVKTAKLYIDEVLIDTQIVAADATSSTWSSDSLTALADIKPGERTVKVEIERSDCSETKSASVIIRLDGVVPLARVAINAGGDQFVGEDGTTYEADRGNTGGGSFTIRDLTKDILETEDDVLYQTERFGTFSYSIDVPSATYDLELIFAEIFFTATAEREFSVSVEGTERVANLDLVETAKPFTAYTLPINDLAIDDGKLDIGIKTIVDNGKISAFRLLDSGKAWDDEDSDGLANIQDNCPYTVAEQVDNIDANGCKKKAPDDDEDTVANDKDTCPGTPATELVDDAGCSSSQKDADNDMVSDDLDLCDSTMAGEMVNAQGCAADEADIVDRPFIESDGIVAVELESLTFPEGWTRKSGTLSLNNGYLEYTGPNKFGEPGTSVISFKVKISNPGIYRVVWRNAVRQGTSATDFNDSWLKVHAESFYGKRGESIVCPKGHDPALNDCTGEPQEGAGGKGWFKVYRSGGNPVSDWLWVTSTNDKLSHTVFAEFRMAGEYEVQISGRSKAHAIDRIVLFRSDNAEGINVGFGKASSITLPESAR